VGKRATSKEIVQAVIRQVRSATPVGKKATSPEIAQMLKVEEMTTGLIVAATSVERRVTLHVTVV